MAMILRTATLSLVVFSAVWCFGQTARGNTLAVTVKNAAGLPVPGATGTLVAAAVDQPQASVSDALGLAWFRNLVPGNYTLTVVKAGFEPVKGLTITISDHSDAEIQVVLSSPGTQETVTAESVQISTNLDGRATAKSENVESDAATPLTPAQETTTDERVSPTARVFQLVLPSEHLLGDWAGLRTKLERKGITPRLILVTDLAGNPTGGRSQSATAPSSVELSLLFDLNKIFGLKGGSVFASFSERWGHSLSAEHIGNTFSTQQIFGFQTWRVIDVSYQQKLFEDRVELRVGRFPAMDDFLVSPYNFGMMSNAFCGNPFGILLDAPGMSAYYGTWAALAKVKPTKRSYVMSGVYNGDPKMRDNKYHGANLSLHGPLFSITEAGYQINGLSGDSRRLGNYKLGAWYDRSQLTDFESGATKRGSWGYYGLFDQVLVPLGAAGSNRGVGVFGSATVAPNSHLQQLPLFVTAGVSVRGFSDARPRDAISFGVSSGYFSEDLQRAQRNGRMLDKSGGVPDRETIFELTYRLDLRRGAFFIQPDFQYINRSGGVGHFKNAPVFGAQFGINF